MFVFFIGGASSEVWGIPFLRLSLSCLQSVWLGCGLGVFYLVEGVFCLVFFVLGVEGQSQGLSCVSLLYRLSSPVNNFLGVRIRLEGLLVPYNAF